MGDLSKRKIISLDIDDVIAGFNRHLCLYYNKKLEKRHYWCTETMDREFGKGWFDEVACDQVFWATLPKLSPPEDIDFEFDYYISAFPEEMREIREEWLDWWGYPKKPLIICQNKKEKCLELRVDILVDDKPSTIQSLMGTPVLGLHFLPWYAGFEPVGEHITNLKQVKNYL